MFRCLFLSFLILEKHTMPPTQIIPDYNNTIHIGQLLNHSLFIHGAISDSFNNKTIYQFTCRFLTIRRFNACREEIIGMRTQFLQILVQSCQQ